MTNRNSLEAYVVRHPVLLFGLVVMGVALLGCGTTMRHMTATSWLEPPGTPAAPAAATAPGGAATPATAPAAGGGVQSQYYITYWEGSCGWPLGCNRGDTHVRRCKVNADNTVTCVEEANATKALNPN
jgi:hypothetical protein